MKTNIQKQTTLSKIVLFKTIDYPFSDIYSTLYFDLFSVVKYHESSIASKMLHD